MYSRYFQYSSNLFKFIQYSRWYFSGVEIAVALLYSNPTPDLSWGKPGLLIPQFSLYLFAVKCHLHSVYPTYFYMCHAKRQQGRQIKGLPSSPPNPHTFQRVLVINFFQPTLLLYYVCIETPCLPLKGCVIFTLFSSRRARESWSECNKKLLI